MRRGQMGIRRPGAASEVAAGLFARRLDQALADENHGGARADGTGQDGDEEGNHALSPPEMRGQRLRNGNVPGQPYSAGGRKVAASGVDVLQDQAVRQGIKSYSDWPTIPQLYVNGEFVGGSDIMMEMYESGELQEVVKAHAGSAS